MTHTTVQTSELYVHDSYNRMDINTICPRLIQTVGMPTPYVHDSYNCRDTSPTGLTRTSARTLVISPPLVEVEFLVDPVEVAGDAGEDVGEASGGAVVDQPAHHAADVEAAVVFTHQRSARVALGNTQ